MKAMSTNRKIVTLSGGVGGAKLVLGLSHVVPAERLVVVTNTGDDFDHLGLRICPDTDTVLYTLAGLSDQTKGWGRSGETWTFMKVTKSLGGESWFNLGDGDLALHVARTQMLVSGRTPTEVTAEIARAWAIEATILPMCDAPVATIVKTTQGPLPFQHYFVREQRQPAVTGFTFDGIGKARPNPALLKTLKGQPGAIIIAPSNPFVSVDPILNIPGMRDALRASGAPIVAVSPIVGGTAIKGPAAKMMEELNLPVSASEVAKHYQGVIDGIIIDRLDAALASEISDLGIGVCVADTIMQNLDDRITLANDALDFANSLHGDLVR